MRQFRFICIAIVVGLALFCAAPVSAQSDPDFETGLKPFGSYHGGNIDVINLSNGSLTIDLPLMSYPQRGGKLNLSFDFRMTNFSYYYTVGYISCPDNSGAECAVTDWETPGNFVGFTQENVPIATGTWTDNGSEYLGQAQITTPDQAIHQLGLTALTGGYWRSADATGYSVAGTYNSDFTGPVIDSNGLRYTSPGAFIPSGWYAASVEDPNGNQISVQTGTGYYATEVTQWTDSTGRIIPAPASTTDYSRCPNSSGTTSAIIWNFPGLNSQTYPVLFCYGGSVLLQYYYWYYDGQDDTGYLAQQTEYIPKLQYIVLPNNTYWTFAYTTDGNANPAKITFPTGGALCYTWNNFVGGNPDSNYQMESQVASRILDPSGTCSQSSPTWTYQRQGPSGGNVTVADPAGNNTVHHFTIPAGLETYYETETDYPAGKTVYNSFTSAGTCANTDGAVLTQTETAWSNGLVDEVQFGYDGGFSAGLPWETDNPPPYGPVLGGGSCLYGLQTSKKEYDYGNGSPGALLRTTSTSYQFQNNGNYLNANLLSLPASVQVTGTGPGSYTTYGYDESGSPQCVCGNETSVNRWLNTTGAYLTTTSVYNSNGLVTSVTDPKSNPTTFGYGSCYAGSGPTSVTNAKNQTTTYCYDFDTGLQTSITDPNNQTTTTSYDNMLRTYQITYPPQQMADTTWINGLTTFTYPTATEVHIDELMDDQSHHRTWNLFVDGLGRLSQTQLTSDPDGTDYTLTTYDGMGRKYEVYNPTRCSAITTNCGESTWGLTSYQYDPLSRPTVVTEQDGSAINTNYSNFPCVTVTDEAGKARESCTDALGRITSVTEDPSGSNYLTSYSYDALDNLTAVTQAGSHQRSFVYDSLSRLTSATNPESGTTSYTYDADANVITKTDARGIVTCYGNWSGSCDGTGYDQLNRVTKKSYSDGTPSSNFQYDATTDWGATLTNTVGRLTESWTGGTPFSGSIDSYDSMGRTILHSQCTPYTCGWGGWGIAATYNLLGDITSSTNGQGTTVSQTFDTAGRLSALTSNFVDANHPGTLWTADVTQGYYPHGAVRKAQFGNGLTWTTLYEPRLMPCRIDLNTSGALETGCSDPFPQGTVQEFAYVHGVWGSTDNGNITGWGGGGVQNFNRSYSYDAVNRLQSMSASGDTCSGLSWNIDTWGNRTDQNATSGSCNTFHQSVDGNNRLTGYSYDADGDLLNDGMHNYSYDAENRITKVDAGTTASYSYDAEGNRTEKTAGGISLEYIYDVTGHVVAEDNGTSWDVGYVYAGDRLVAQYDSGTTHFIHQDHLGSTRLVTDMSGNVYDSLDYLPYGEQTVGDTATTHKFTGKERDGTATTETGLDNFGARYYSSGIGRFMSPDEIGPGQHPENPQSWNLYSYVTNNPLTLIDPTGEYTCDLTTADHQGTMTQDQCDEFQGKLNQAQAYANSLKDTYGANSDKYMDAQRAIDAYGAEGVDNGVHIQIGDPGQGAIASTFAQPGSPTILNPSGQDVTVTIRNNFATSGDQSVAAIAHEGSHVADADEWLGPGANFGDQFRPTSLETESRAYGVTIGMMDAAGATSLTMGRGDSNRILWNKYWPQAVNDVFKTNSIKALYPNWNQNAWQLNTKGNH
jgi:RHS repeat-associated protein